VPTRPTVVFPAALWNDLLGHLGESIRERMAFAYCGVAGPSRLRRYTVRELDLPADSECCGQSELHVSLRAEHAARRAVRARECRAFLDMHSHLFSAVPVPSATDTAHACRQHEALQVWAPGIPLIRMIFGAGGTVWAGVQHSPGGPVDPVDAIDVAGDSRLIRIRPGSPAP
jgi:hypothetical protein